VARLPQPGGDSGQWGNILNEYLSESLSVDGTLNSDTVGAPQLKPNSVTSAAIADGQITSAKLADGSVTPVKFDGLGEAGGIATLDGTAKLPENQVPERLSELELNTMVEAQTEARLSRDALAAGRRLAAQTAGTRSVLSVAPDFVVTVLGVRDSVTPGPSTDLGVATVDVSADTFTVAAPHGLVVGDPVGFGARSGPNVVTSNTLYYVCEVVSSTAFTVSATLGGGRLNMGGANGTMAATWKNYPRRYNAYDRITPRVLPQLQITRGKAVQANAAAPRYDMITRDSTVQTYAPGVSTGTSLRAECYISGVRVLDVMLFNSGQGRHDIYIDGALVKRITVADMTAASVPTSQTARAKITLPDVGRHKITWEAPGNETFAGFDIPLAGSLTYPTDSPKGPRTLVVGDSFTEGGDAVSSGGYPYAEWVGWHMGWRDLWKLGSGSTGYLANGTRMALIDRYENDIIANQPDVLILAMGLNDPRATEEDRSATVAAAETIWDAVRADLPFCDLTVVGPFPNAGGVGVAADLVLLSERLKEATRTRGIRFIDPIGEGWTFTRTDATHPDAAGAELIGMRIAGHLSIPHIAA